MRFVTNQDFDGENEEDVNKLMRSLPEDTNKMVSNYIKDVFVSSCQVSQGSSPRLSEGSSYRIPVVAMLLTMSIHP